VASEEGGMPQMQYSHYSRFWENEENLIYQHLFFLLITKKYMTI
jgi:hypothetical protein